MKDPFIQCAHTEVVDISTLKPHPLNDNVHPEEQVDLFVKILRYQGQRRAVTVSNRSGFITKGHGLVLGAQKMGRKTLAIDRQNYKDEAQELADIKADNELARLAQTDEAKLRELMLKLPDGFDMQLLGAMDLKLPGEEKKPGCGEDDVPAAPKVILVKAGELFQCGNHRVLCGDSTKKETVLRLMGGEKADLVFTDPPYGVSYADKNAFLNRVALGKRIQERIQNDHGDLDDMKKLWDGFLASAAEGCHDKASYYVCSPQGGELMMMIAISDSPWQLKHTIIWVKNNHVLGRSDYHYRHEPILYGWKKKGTHSFLGAGRCKTSVWDFAKPLKNDLHPTMKPVELVEEAIANSCPKEGKVLDVFLGSGTTMIAAEKTGRACFGIELAPEYAHTSIDRWQRYSGKRAYRLNPDGTKTKFDDIKPPPKVVTKKGKK